MEIGYICVLMHEQVSNQFNFAIKFNSLPPTIKYSYKIHFLNSDDSSDCLVFPKVTLNASEENSFLIRQEFCAGWTQRSTGITKKY